MWIPFRDNGRRFSLIFRKIIPWGSERQIIRPLIVVEFGKDSQDKKNILYLLVDCLSLLADYLD